MGRIVGAFGVQGWLKVKPYTEQADTLGGHPAWVVDSADGWVRMELQDFAVHSKGPVAKLEGCEDRAAAERLRHRDVAVPREALGEAGEGTLYWVDLLGLAVVDEDGSALGSVEGFFETGETSVMVVRGVAPQGEDKAGRERLIPFVPGYVKSVDREARRIVVDWKPDYDA
jgi:16S rRNA processing protein RimM